MSRRINARIDDGLAHEIERLGRLTGKSTSAIIKAALQGYGERVRSAAADPKRALQAAGFIGCAEGDPRLSIRYKDDLTRSWSKKA